MVPDNAMGTQDAHGGNAYAGVWAKSEFYEWHEYLSAPLLDTLIAGATYHAGLYVSLGEAPPYTGSDGLGIFFSNGAPDTLGVGWPGFQLTPQIANPPGNMLDDVINWQLLEGSFIANGGENFITIGNFTNDTATIGTWAYFYVDDVYLFLHDPSLGVGSFQEEDPFVCAPNPFTEYTEVRLGLVQDEVVRASLLNAVGAEVRGYDLRGAKTLRIERGDLPAGLYFLRISLADGSLNTVSVSIVE